MGWWERKSGATVDRSCPAKLQIADQMELYMELYDAIRLSRQITLNGRHLK
jgi:hypothetical protein